MSIDKKILSEISRYNQINKYISEQELPPPPPADPMMGGDPNAVPPADPMMGDPNAMPQPQQPMADPNASDLGGGMEPQPIPEPINPESDPEVEKVDDTKKEVEVTDLVNTQKSVEEKQEQYFDTLFQQLNDLEEKLSAMDNIMDKLNSLEVTIEKYREKTPEEKLELRSLDSGPFNQKLTDFFQDKEEDFEKSGKEQYILTKDEIENYSPNEIKNSFDINIDDEIEDDNYLGPFDKNGFSKIY